MFTFYFDNTIVSNPINWSELSEQIERSEELRGLFLKIDQTYTFTGDAYSYLYNTKTNNGYCEFVRLQIVKTCNNVNTLVFDGNIRLSDCKFNLSKCMVECGIEDNSFGARIFNNKSIKAFVNGGFSKNGIAITPANTYNLLLYQPSTNILDNTAHINAFDVMECFQYLVQFMTDGQMNVVSDWYTNLPPTEKICLVVGAELRKRQHLNIDTPNISFDELFKEMNKKFNLGMSVENINGIYTLRIEPINYYYTQNISATTNNIDDLIEFIDTKNLYSNIKLGSNKSVVFDNTIHSMPPVRFLTFNEEDYIIQGQCNIDRTLDTVSTYVIDSNIIEEVAFTKTNDSGNDKEIFMIQYERNLLVPFVFISVMWNDISTIPPSFFNKVLTNDSVSVRWDVQGNIAQYLNATNASFRAEQTINSATYYNWVYPSITAIKPPIYEPVPFDDDSTPPNFDAGGNYNPTTYRYTATANGIYTFRFLQNYIANKAFWSPVQRIISGNQYIGGSGYYVFDQWRLFTNVYSGVTLLRQNFSLTQIRIWKTGTPATWTRPLDFSSGTFWGVDYLTAPFWTQNQQLQNDVTTNIYLNAGEEVEFGFEYAYNEIYRKYVSETTSYIGGASPLPIVPASNDEIREETGVNSYTFLNSSVECVSTANGAGIYKGSNPDDYKVSLFSYDYPISDVEWEVIKTSPRDAIQFGTNSASKFGWVNRISRNANTGMASIELISNINNTKN